LFLVALKNFFIYIFSSHAVKLLLLLNFLLL
jgi:hypothetical protein